MAKGGKVQVGEWNERGGDTESRRRRREDEDCAEERRKHGSMFGRNVWRGKESSWQEMIRVFWGGWRGEGMVEKAG